MKTCEWVDFNDDERCGDTSASFVCSFRSTDDMPIIFSERDFCEKHSRMFRKAIERNYSGRGGTLVIGSETITIEARARA